ncbi:hypothetical protein MTsPCn3_11770 [Erythrobacter sp. MTPC3]
MRRCYGAVMTFLAKWHVDAHFIPINWRLELAYDTGTIRVRNWRRIENRFGSAVHGCS